MNNENTNSKRNANIMSIIRHNVDCARLSLNGNDLLVWELDNPELRDELSQRTLEIAKSLEELSRWCKANGELSRWCKTKENRC